MNQEQARTDVLTVLERIRAEFPDYALQVQSYNNEGIDQATQVDPYLEVEIDFLPGGGQLSLGQDPVVKQLGQIALYAVVKKGAGESHARRLLDFASPYFDMQVLGGVNTHATQAYRAKERDGLVYFPMLVDFYYTRTR